MIWNIKLIGKPDVNDINWLGGGDVVVEATLVADPTVRKELRFRIWPDKPEEATVAFIEEWARKELEKHEQYLQNLARLARADLETTITV